MTGRFISTGDSHHSAGFCHVNGKIAFWLEAEEGKQKLDHLINALAVWV